MLIVLDRSRQLAIVAEPVKKTGCSLAGRYTLIVHVSRQVNRFNSNPDCVGFKDATGNILSVLEATA